MIAAWGGTMADVVSLVHYATDVESFMSTGDIRKKSFQLSFPVTTTVQVSRLYHPNLIIEVTAGVPRSRACAFVVQPAEALPGQHVIIRFRPPRSSGC